MAAAVARCARLLRAPALRLVAPRALPCSVARASCALPIAPLRVRGAVRGARAFATERRAAKEEEEEEEAVEADEDLVDGGELDAEVTAAAAADDEAAPASKAKKERPLVDFYAMRRAQYLQRGMEDSDSDAEDAPRDTPPDPGSTEWKQLFELEAEREEQAATGIEGGSRPTWKDYMSDPHPEILLPDDVAPTRAPPRLLNFHNVKGKCLFCLNQIGKKRDHPKLVIEYYNVQLLHQFINERGSITNRRMNYNCPPHQRKVARAIKRARFIGLLDHSSDRTHDDFLEEVMDSGGDEAHEDDLEEVAMKMSMEDENATEETIAAKLEELRRRAALPPGER